MGEPEEMIPESRLRDGTDSDPVSDSTNLQQGLRRTEELAELHQELEGSKVQIMRSSTGHTGRVPQQMPCKGMKGRRRIRVVEIKSLKDTSIFKMRQVEL